MKIAILGGGGYVGSMLVPHLLEVGHTVTVLDTFWFGNYLPKESKYLKIIEGDVRHSPDLRLAIKNQDAVIHLACISNDPSVDMNPRLGEEINYACFRNLIAILWECNIKRFIYASSSSVYGVSERVNVTEGAPTRPLTAYSRFKVDCEMELHLRKTPGYYTIIRPATVCGYSPRMRFDLVVNKLTIDALIDKKITIFGTEQKRPNINIKDMCRAYEWVLCQPPLKVHTKSYNVGFENLRLPEIAALVKETLKNDSIEIVEKPVNDPRSYHIDSSKIRSEGFLPLYSIADGIRSIKENIKSFVNPLENPEYYNIKQMKGLGL